MTNQPHKMNPEQARDWALLLKMLRKRCPTKVPVRVLRRRIVIYKGDEVSGYCDESRSGLTYMLYVSTSQSWQGQVDTVVHEWGHARYYDEHDWHDPEWGERYSEAYQAYEEWTATI